MSEIVNLLRKNPKEVRTEAANLSPSDAASAMQAIDPIKDPHWKEKTSALFFGVPEREHIEAIGRHLTMEQALEMITQLKSVDPTQQWRLSALLVGFGHQMFMKLMDKGSIDQLQVIQQAGLKEPVQHHLLMLIQEIQKKFETADLDLASLINQIDNLNAPELTTPALTSLEKELVNWNTFYQNLSDQVNRALSLAWNTNRPDLIEKLNSLKSIADNGRQNIVKDLRRELESKLMSVFGDPTNLQDLEFLQDDDPGIEVLAKLSLWYLKDYWEIGLLPEIKKEEDLYQDPSQQYREKLLVIIKKNLENLNLSAVGDFKKARIFSKKMLRTYINNFFRS